MYYILVILMFPLSVFAGDIDQCNQIHEHNQHSLCVAKATLSANECEKITNLEMKTSCIFAVRDAQRQVNSFHPTK